MHHSNHCPFRNISETVAQHRASKKQAFGFRPFGKSSQIAVGIPDQNFHNPSRPSYSPSIPAPAPLEHPFIPSKEVNRTIVLGWSTDHRCRTLIWNPNLSLLLALSLISQGVCVWSFEILEVQKKTATNSIF